MGCRTKDPESPERTEAAERPEAKGGLSRRELFSAGATTAGAWALASIARVPEANALASPGPAVRLEVAKAPALSRSVRRVAVDPVLVTRRRRGTKVEFGDARLLVAPDPAAEQDIRDWLEPVADGTCLRRDIHIEILERDGSGVRTFDLFDCFPTQFSTRDVEPSAPDVQHWTLEVRVNRIEMA